MIRTYLFLLLMFCCALPLRAQAQLRHAAPNPKATVVYRWVEIMLEAAGREVDRVGARPTILSREMAIVTTAMYDAWAAYDARAVGTRLGAKLRRPPAERTLANKEKAVSYAAYRSLLSQYAVDKDWLTEQMVQVGYDPADVSTDPSTASGVGNVAAQAVIDYRLHDGSNQTGDEAGSSGKPYSDYTGYKPKNTAQNIVDPDCWTPIAFSDGKGGTVTPGFLTPHWYKVKPLGLATSDQFRPPPPPKAGSKELAKDVQECIDVNANLTIQQKALVEFMRDGPRSTGQSGHWLRFAEDVARRDHDDLDRDVKLFFVIGNGAFDSFISCWEAKRFYDSSRPFWYVPYLVKTFHKGEKIRGWLGPGKGVGWIEADQWRPYSPATFITPPFPGYTSGHSTVSATCSRLLELFTGSDKFGFVALRTAGTLTEANVPAAQMQASDGKPATDVPATTEVVLDLPTFSKTAQMAALSRLLGGYHIRTDNEVGFVYGVKMADYLWPQYKAYFDGTATVKP